MKTKLASRLTRTIGLTTGLSVIALCTVPIAIAMALSINPVYAERPNPTIQLMTPDGLPNQFPGFAGIDLTEEQKEQIKEIRRDIQPQFEAILPRPELTPEQQNQLASGEPIRLSLPAPTSEQKAEMERVMQIYRQKIEAILTPAQQEQFRQNQSQDVIFLERSH
jgi:Spy/CpxP family protein refolding chaperone